MATDPDGADALAMMEALGIERRDETYLHVDADASGRLLHTSEAEHSRRLQRATSRRQENIASGDPAISSWNQYADAAVDENLATTCDGQGHRVEQAMALGYIPSNSNPNYQVTTGRASRGTPTAQPTTTATASPSNPQSRQCAASPRSFGTIRVVNGVRSEVQQPSLRHAGHPINSQALRSENSAPTRNSSHGRPVSSDRSSGRPASSISRTNNRAGTYTGETEQQMRERALQELVTAAENMDVGSKILPQTTDDPDIARMKTHIRNVAVCSAEPSDFIKSKGTSWTTIFRAFRHLFVEYAFSATKSLQMREQCISHFSRGTPDFQTLCDAAAQALQDAKTCTPSLRTHYLSQGKKDLLDKALSKLKDHADEPSTIANATAPVPSLSSTSDLPRIADHDAVDHVTLNEDAQVITASDTASGERKGILFLTLVDKEGQRHRRAQMNTPIQGGFHANVQICTADAVRDDIDMTNPEVLIAAITSIASAFSGAKQELESRNAHFQTQQGVDDGASDDSEL